MINNRDCFFYKKSDFINRLQDISPDSVCYIADTQQIYTHGRYFECNVTQAVVEQLIQNHGYLTAADLPVLTGGASPTPGEYVSGVSVGGHNVNVQKGKLSEINVGTASKLETPRKIELSGDLSGSIMFDGSQDVNIETIVHNSTTADRLTTPRTISLSSQATGQVSFDGNGNVDIPVTVNELDSKNSNNRDLNSLVTLNGYGGSLFYGIGGNTSVNKPPGVDWFGLFSFKSASGNYTTQILGSNNRLYSRSNADTSLGSWNTIAYLTDNVASATKLQNTRTFIISDGTNSGTASSFDGTGNITLRLPGTINANIIGDITGDIVGDVTGNLHGNADTATKLQTGRNINGTLFDGTQNITTAQWGTARNLTIGNSTKSVNGSTNISWTLSEIGAVNKAGDTMTGMLNLKYSRSNSSMLDITNTAGGETYFRLFSGNNYVGAFTANQTQYGTAIYNQIAGGLYLGITNSGVPHFQGNTLLHSGNYTSYTVTKTGGGASGSWPISISGIANRAVYLTSTYTGSGGLQPPSYFNGMGLKVNMMNQPVSYCDVIVVNGYGGQGSDVPYINALAFQKTANTHGDVYHARGDYGGSSWGTWYKFLDSGNYADYTVTKTGGGASGTWNINISGTAAKANSVAWANVSGKPSSYTPSSHTHTASQVSGLATVATSGSYNDLTNKPTIPTIPSLSVTNSGSGNAVTGITVSGHTITVTKGTISSIDTKNTTGTSNSTQKLYLVGGISQSNTGVVTYSNNAVYTQSGQLYASQMNATNGFFETSDARLKDFKEDIKALDTVDQIPTKYFTWKEDESKELQIGTSAQEVEKLYPELVSKTGDDTLTVDYAKLSIIALAAIKELKAEIQSLKEEIKQLKSNNYDNWS